MNAADTNILIYVHDRRNVRKQAIAESLVRTLPQDVLLWQVACEYISASRKLEPLGYSKEKAWEDIHKLRKLWVAQLPTWETFERTENIGARGRKHHPGPGKRDGKVRRGGALIPAKTAIVKHRRWISSDSRSGLR